jgi:threonylcarbamoyladenosine tRNA methylthiotransferase MtaB
MIQYKKVAFYTLGCKLNFSETSTISRLFEDAGYAKVDMEERPDIFVLNTCSVTENADKKCKQLVKKVMKQNPETFVIVIGCYAQLKPEEIAQIPGVDMVLGANEKFNVLEHLDSMEQKGQTKVAYEHIKQPKKPGINLVKQPKKDLTALILRRLNKRCLLHGKDGGLQEMNGRGKAFLILKRPRVRSLGQRRARSVSLSAKSG